MRQREQSKEKEKIEIQQISEANEYDFNQSSFFFNLIELNV